MPVLRRDWFHEVTPFLVLLADVFLLVDFFPCQSDRLVRSYCHHSKELQEILAYVLERHPSMNDSNQNHCESFDRAHLQ